MKKTKILSALVVSSLVGAMTFGVSNPAVAASDINITGATGEGNEGPWYSGSMGPSSTDLSTSNNDGGSRDYEDWAGSQTDDVVNLSGTGSLDLNHDLGTNHGTLNATGGSLTISGGNITLNSGDSVGAAVNFAVNSGATLGIDGGSAILNSGDTISGAINATNGTLNVASGAHNFGTNSIIANNVTLTVGDEATLGITGGNVTIGTGDAINGTINNSSGSLNVNNSISVGSLTNSNTSDTAVVLGSNTLTVNNGLTNSGALSSNNTGSVVTNGTSSNTGNVSVDSFTVASGSLTNSGSGSIDANSMTVNQGATLNNSANIGEQGNSLSTFTNNGTTNNTGNIYSNTVTNNKTFTNDTDGTINATDVINNGATLTNNSTINTTNYTNQKNGSADATTTNNGTINATTLNNDSNFTNNADGKVDANAINNTAGVFTNKGTVGATSSLNTLNNSEGAKFVNENTVNASTVNNNGEYQNSTAGSVLNATTFNNNSGSQFINNGTSTIETLNNASSITGDGGTLNVTSGGTSSGTIVQKSIALTTGNFENTGTMTSNTSFSNGAVITGDNGTLNVKDATFGANVTQSSLSIIGEATNATSTIDVGTLTIGSETNTGASLTGTNGTLNMDGGTNYGTISEKDVNVGGDYVNNGSLTSTGTFVNETGAEITGTGDLEVAAATFGADVTQDEIVINGEATNTNATITATALTVGADGSLEGKAISTANGTNEGTITQEDITITGDYVNNGSMESTGEFTNSGNISGDDDSSLTVTDGTNSGSIQQHSLTVNDNEDGFTNESTGTIVADSIANSGDFTNNNVTDAGAITVDTLTNDATGDESFENSGNLVVNGDDAGNGLTNSGVFNNNGDGNILATVIDNEANGEFTNSGDIAAVTDEELDITNATGGTFTNDTTGTIVADSITNSGDFANNNVTDDGAITVDTLTNDATGDESFENSGNLVVNGDDAGNGLTNSGVFNNNGDGNILATVIDNEANGEFTNSGDIAAVIDEELDITNATGGTFTNDTTGTIVADSITNSGDFVNNNVTDDGAITTDTLTNDATGDESFENSGNLVVNGDDAGNGLTNSGVFNNNGDGNILATVIDNEANGEFTNSGDIAAVIDEELDITNATGGTFTNDTTGTIVADSITNSGDFVNNNVTDDGAITTDTLTNDATGDESFENSGNLVVNGDDEGNGLTNSGVFNNNGDGNILATVIDNEAGTFTNSGDIAGVATTDPVTGETTYDLDITNESGATFTNDTTGTIVADSIENSGTFANNSTVEDAITTDTLTNTANGTFTNSGDLIVNGDVDAQGDPIGLTNSGTFTNNDDILATVIDNEANGEFTNAGDIAAVTDEELDITNESGATFTNEATGSVQATTITNNGDMSNEYADEDTKGSIVADTITNMPEGTLTNDGDVTANNTFNNTGTVNNTDEGLGTLNVKDGSNTGAGEITQGIMNIASDGEFTNNNAITIEDELNNKGILNNTVADDPDAPVPSITVQNSTNDAVLNNTNTINSEGKDADNQALITADTLTNNGGTINLTNSKVAVVYQADDISGTINVLGDTSEDVSEISITGNQPNFAGELNVGDDDNSATAKLTAGNVVEDAVVDITSGSALNVDAASADDPTSLVMDSGDTYEGDLVLDNGDVTMKDLNINTGDTPTTEGGTKPYYGQNGGSLTLENSTLDMDDASQIQGGDLTVDKDSTFRSEKNGFIVDNLESAGTVDGLNGGYEDYIVDDNQGTGTMRIGDEDGDSTADFTTDIYARSNSNSNSDHYGSDDATITATDGEEGTINISDWNLNGDIYGWDAPIDRNIALDDIIKGQVDENVTINFTATNKEVKTPIGWYGLHSNGNGSYSFGLNRYNPAVFRGQITKIAQYQNQLMIDDMLFNHTMVDQGFKGNDYIASNPNRLASSGDLFPPYQYSRKDGGLWVKMYGTFENLQMNVGKVGNNAYGTIIGADFGLKELRNGWQFMPTAYIGYNGAHQYWKGNGAYQNGGQAGLMGTWYKDNFMVGALAYGGVYNNNMDTPRGDDNTLGYFAGGAVKTAYNWRFAKDWSLQPNFLVAYNFFGQENWHTDFGQMGMMSGMLHGINIAPGVNLIWEKETFSIYGTLQYMYNVNQSTGGRAGNVGLPHVHMDRGYIQYGLGFNKRFSDRFSGFFQAVLRNVGRTGVGLQAGFQWQLGKAGSGEIKGKTPELKKTEVILNNHK